MAGDGETWCVADMLQRLVSRRATLRALWDKLEQKHLERRRENRQAIDALVKKKLQGAYIKRADKLRLKPKSREDAERCAQYEGEIAMITAALRALSSPSAFAQAISETRAGTNLGLSREEVVSYRRGLERQFVALSAWLTGEHAPENRPRHVVNKPMGWRVRSVAFEVDLLRAAPAPEPEFQSQALAQAPERLRTAKLRRRVLAVAERDLALCERCQVRAEERLGVIARAQLLTVLHQILADATCYNDVRRAVMELPRRARVRLPWNLSEVVVQSLLNEALGRITADVNAVLAGKNPGLAIRAKRPSFERALRRAVTRAECFGVSV